MQKKAFCGDFGLLATVLAFAAAFFSFTAGAPQAKAAGLTVLNGHVPPAIARFNLQPLRILPPASHLNLAISLPLRNEQGLNDLLQKIYDPTSPKFHHYLTPEQFTAQFGPSQQDYDAVLQFMRSNGLTVTATYPNRTLVDVSGSVATVQQVFHTTLHVYQHPYENRTFFAPDTDPSLDLNVPIAHVSGLDNFTIPRPAIKIKNSLDRASSGAKPASGSGPDGLYMGKDFRAAYAPGVTLDGTGQTVGLLELEGYYQKDILTYETNAGLPNVTLTNIPVGSFAINTADTNGIIEVSLDIEMVISMATNCSQVAVFEEQNGGNVVDILDAIATNNFVKQISSSWLIGDSSSYDTVYKEFAAQGQSFFQASGDDGAFYTSNEQLEEYTDDTNITLVGGTTLSTTGGGGAWSSETVWNWYSSGQGAAASGGGTNFNGIPIPSWQQGVSMANNQGSTTLRNVPDVALTGDNIYVQATNQGFYIGGTSCAAPLWAGFTALINQQAAAAGQPYVGFLNPAIYAIGQSANYTNDFHDITTGNNTNSTVSNKYFAAPGYDLCTGWGTPNGQNLINALVAGDILVINPKTGFNAVGVAGGPFSPNSQVYTLTNSSASPLTWSLINTSFWLNASATGSVLTAGSVTNITISLAPAANALPVGTNSATLLFTDLVTHVSQSYLFNLHITEPLGISPTTGFSAAGQGGGPFSPNSQVYTLTNSSASSLTWSLINTSSWLSASATSSLLAAGGATNITISLNAAAGLLSAGAYGATLTFTDWVSHVTQNLQFSLQVTEPLAIGPAAGFNATGASGGPFNILSEIFSLTNIGSASLNWQAASTSWLNVSPSAGVLAGSGVAPVTVSLNSSANNLAAGIYTGQVSFTDETSGVAQNRQFTLTIGQNIVQNGGFETGDFTDWNLIGTTINHSGTVYNDVVSVATVGSVGTNFIHSGTYGAALGHSKFSYLYQSLATTPGQNYLFSCWLNNPGGYTPNQFLVDWNTNATGANTVFNQTEIGAINNWTNILLVLTATGTNTTLVFGSQNNSYYFGLDDINAWPIPSPNIRGFSTIANNNALTLTWNSFTDVVYEVEYSTNLASTNWFILSTNTAIGPTLSVTNPMGPNPAMFYRVLRLP